MFSLGDIYHNCCLSSVSQAVFQQQMAALRAQLEAMQAQRPGGQPGLAVQAPPAAPAQAQVGTGGETWASVQKLDLCLKLMPAS